MSEELVRIEAAPATMLLIGDRPMALPQLIADAGPAAAERFLEFFAAQIANDHTRAAYARGGAVSRLVRSAEPHPPRLRAAPRCRLHPHPIADPSRR